MERFTMDKLSPRVLAELDLQTVFMASRLVVAAERFQVLRKLNGRSQSAAVIGRRLGIHPSYSEGFLNALVSLGLLRKSGGLYGTSALGERYFVEGRSIYWTRHFSGECVETFNSLTVLEQVLKSGKDPRTILRKKRRNYIELMKGNTKFARDFTLMLYHYHRADADALAKHLDLKAFRSLLDVGGGSGVMSLALAKKNPHIRACILDIAPVCRVARKVVKSEGLSSRVKAVAGDMRRALPSGHDVIMFCDIGHLHGSLLRRAYRILPEGGMVVLVDRFMSDDRTKPLDRLLYEFTRSSFGTETRREMVQALRACGFRAVKRRNIYKDVWMITGLKKR